MGWVDAFHWNILVGVLDVLLVSFLIYRILLMVRGTRAQPMLAGLAVLVLVYAISREVQLVTLNWILGNFLGSVILVIVVLFQEDIRRGLVQVGLGPGGLSSNSNYQVGHTISEVAQAAAELSARRLGALIVIARDVGLDEYVENAVQIDAVVSHQLLTSIFLSTSPIHDGAVIVAGKRIIAAGAVLPITFSPTLSQHFGTRHRAAVGLTERTDALVVVVSEETGTISLVREGKFTRDLNEKTLYNALHRMIVVRSQKRMRRRNFGLFGKRSVTAADRAGAGEASGEETKGDSKTPSTTSS